MKLPSVDDLFSTEESRQEAKHAKIYEILLSEIDDFPDHPFKVRDDEDMENLIESIRERGVITPATVRKMPNGRYEMISGHRRKRACEKLGMETLRCEVVDRQSVSCRYSRHSRGVHLSAARSGRPYPRHRSLQDGGKKRKQAYPRET